jgi:putative transposase
MTTRRNGGRSSATPPQSANPNTQPDGSVPQRKHPAHFPAVESGFRSVVIFLTVCTRDRRPLLANTAAVELIREAWFAANFWVVGRYVILPDHIHLFCAPNTTPPDPLKNWISFWKNRVTRARPRRDQVPIWQAESWDRQLRRGESYDEKWDYVVNNPVRHGYASSPEAWPIGGSLTSFNGTIVRRRPASQSSALQNPSL